MMSDAEIMNGIRKRDRNALVMLYRQKYHTVIRPKIKTVLKERFTESRAKEIMNDIALYVYNKLEGSTLQIDNLDGYLAVSAYNMAIKIFREEKRDRKLKENFTEVKQHESFYDIHDNSFDMLKQNIEYSQKALFMLGEKCMKILSMYYMQDLSMKQISDRLSYKSERSVITQKSRCLEQLREKFTHLKQVVK